MGKHYLLLGAGFSRDWGGWLANEVFNYLVGTSEVQDRPEVQKALWHFQNRGGFEAALEDLQTKAQRSDTEARTNLHAFQTALQKMFAAMNEGYLRKTDGFSHSLCSFLARFDAIFTLNQDLLLERRYVYGGFPIDGGMKKWNGVGLPGITRPNPQLGEWEIERWRDAHWTVGNPPTSPTKNIPQYIYKLHGSANWFRDDGKGLLIVGGAKTTGISGDPLLRWYLERFADNINEPNARLMVIGYSFSSGDDHISKPIIEAGKKGLKVAIVDPMGANVGLDPKGDPRTTLGQRNRLEGMVIGASQRSIRETFATDNAEQTQLMRFFG